MASKKIKKVLKMLGAGAAIAGLGKAFMANRNRNAMLEGADANDGFLNSMIGKINPNRMMTPQDMANDEMFTGAMAKKGGRIKKTKKGGRAVRKANRSKKK